MQNRLTIEFRHKQNYDFGNISNPVIVQCNPDGTASYVPGTVPGINWVDMTDNTEGLDNFSLSWDAVANDYTEGDNQEANQFGSNYNKGVTGDLRFYGPAFNYIFDWLMTTPCQILNAIEVRIKDNEAGKYFRIFELKLDNIEYMPYDEPCLVSVPLAENDQVWHSFQTTIIEDDFQQWFNSDGLSTKQHPTFGMVVEKKPKFFMAIFGFLIYLAGMLSTGLLIGFDEGKRWIRKALGVVYFVPSPLIRDYIQNICTKYGYSFDTMFDDKDENPYRDLCLFYPVTKAISNFDNFTAQQTQFIWENRTVFAFSDFLNQLKKVFNAEWYVTPNKTLVFKPKAFFDNQEPIYDFTLSASVPFWKLKYTFDGTKKPAYGDYQYQIDPQDSCTNEIKWRYNTIVDFDGPTYNPLLEGNVTKAFDFAPTAFQNDGTGIDWLEDGVHVGRLIAAGAVIIGLSELFVATNPLLGGIAAAALTIGYNITNNFVNIFFNNSNLNGMVRSSASEVNTPRLLLYDRNTPLNQAKVQTFVAPSPYLKYNPTSQDYYKAHPATDAPDNYFGTAVRQIYNYPMYVDSLFTNNLYDRFHEYDNPLNNPLINQTFEGEVDLCTEMMTVLGAWEDSFAKIGAVLTIEKRGTRIIKGRISEIKPDYKTGKITIKGNVLK